MKRIPLLWLTLSLVLCALVAMPAHRAMADDETDELEFRVQGTLAAADCTANTISVLGLSIAIGTARIDTTGGVCTDLVVGDQVEAKLASDILNDAGKLKAGRVTPQGNSGSGPRLKGPIQTVNADKSVITLFGLNVAVNNSTQLGGLDDHGSLADDTVDPSQLIVGQFVQVRLAGETPPLLAEEVEIENFTNEVEVEIENEHGIEIHDRFEIEVHNHTLIRTLAAAAPLDGATARRSRTRTFKTRSHGNFTLHGLFSGEARIELRREHNGRQTRAVRVIRIRGDRTGHLRIRLHS